MLIVMLSIYCKYTLRVSGLEVIYFIFLQCIYFLAIHSSLTFKGHRRNIPSLKILVSAADLQAYQIILLDSIRVENSVELLQ